jgi:hypothetical protein
MKKVVTIVVVALFCASMAFAGEYTGYVTDKGCAGKGKYGKDHEGCAKSCLGKDGSVAVLVTEDGKVYAVKQQDQVKPHAGHLVKINGSASGMSIESIENVEHIRGS